MYRKMDMILRFFPTSFMNSMVSLYQIDGVDIMKYFYTPSYKVSTLSLGENLWFKSLGLKCSGVA